MISSSGSGRHYTILLLALLNMAPALEVQGRWDIWAIALVTAVVSVLLTRPDGVSRIPESAIYLAIPAALLYLLYEMFWPHDEQTVYILDLAHFMTFLGCCKFLELRTHRDVALLLVISFLLLVISAFVSASPLFGVVLVLDATIGVAWLISFQERREVDAIHRRHGSARNAPVWTILRDSDALSPWRSVAMCSGALIMAAVLCFVLTPRGWGRGLLGRMQRAVLASTTGFDDFVQLRDNPLVEDQTTVMRARFTKNGIRVEEESFHPYLRGSTFDRYDRGKWRRTHQIANELIPIASETQMQSLNSVGEQVNTEDTITQEYWIESVGKGHLFSLYPPLAVGSSQLHSIQQDPLDMCLQTPERPAKRFTYSVRSATTLSPRQIAQLDPPLDSAQQEPELLDNVSTQVIQFSRNFVARYGDAADPAQHAMLARRIRDYLASPLFRYTLKRPPKKPASDPVQDFLFQNRQGHCEYFASAMTVMCQAVGIQARLVNGYYAGEFNAVGGFYQFRQKDAHAWVEVYLPRRGWVTFDPSPVSEIENRTPAKGFWATYHRFTDYMQFKWATAIVSYDQQSRYDLTERFQKWFSRLGEERDGRTGVWSTICALCWGPDVLALWQRLFYWLLLILCSAFVILMLRILWILSLMVRELFPRYASLREQKPRCADAKFYDRILLLLANKGHYKAPHVTPREFAAALARSHPDLREMPEFTEWFYEMQYGRGSLNSQRWERIKAFLQHLREEGRFALSARSP